MIQTDVDSATAIFASDGATIHRLRWRPSVDAPILVDDAGIEVAPWEMHLLHWPPAAEAALRRGGYLPVRPSDTELWCNCID